VTQPAPSVNFGFLARYDATLESVAARAERYFPADPVTSLMLLRQLGELLAQQLAARMAVFTGVNEKQADLLARFRRDGVVSRAVQDLFHDLRRLGNEATHEHKGDLTGAMTALKAARQLAIFFHRTFGDRSFKPGPFEPPRTPPDATADLTEYQIR
jgi:type I restriction enzyme R subunit